jgi:hypothetical protein
MNPPEPVPMATASLELRGRRNSTQRPDYTPTPDRRYFVVRGRLWRLSNPRLDPEIHAGLVRELMAARRVVRDATDPQERIAARLKVDATKKACESRLCPEPKGRPVRSFPAKGTSWTQSPLLPTNKGSVT